MPTAVERLLPPDPDVDPLDHLQFDGGQGLGESKAKLGELLPAKGDNGLLLPAVQGQPGLLLPAKGEHGLLLPAVKGLLLPAVKGLIGLLLPAVLLFFVLTLLPPSATLGLFGAVGVDSSDFVGDGSVIPACDGSVMPSPAPPPPDAPPSQYDLLENLFLMMNNFQAQMGQQPMLCKSDTNPDSNTPATGPQVPISYCGDGVRDFSSGEMCDGSDLTGCFSGQSCSEDCSCVWVVTEEPPSVNSVDPCLLGACPTPTATVPPPNSPTDPCSEPGRCETPQVHSTDEPPTTCECRLVDTCLPTASCPRYVDSCTGATCRP